MKSKIISVLILFHVSCQNNNSEIESPTNVNDKQETRNAVSLQNFNLHLLNLTEIDNELVVFSSCDGGNAEIFVYTFNDSCYILLTGTQEDELYLVQEAYKMKSDTIYFRVNFYGDKKEGLIKYTITDSVKGVSNWQIKALDMNYSLNCVQDDKKDNFKSIEQPCKECWEEDGICEEKAKNDSIERSEKPIESIERLSKFWRTEAWAFYDYPSSKEIKEKLRKVETISNKDAEILILTYLNCDSRDNELKNLLTEKLKTNRRISLKVVETYKADEKHIKELNSLKEIIKSSGK